MLQEIEEHFYLEEREDARKRLEGNGTPEDKIEFLLDNDEVVLRNRAQSLMKALDRLVDLNDTRQRAIMHGTATMLRDGLWNLLQDEFDTPGDFVRFILHKEREKNSSASFLSNMDFILEILVPAMERLGMNVIDAINMLAPKAKTKAREAVPEMRMYIEKLDGKELREALETVLSDILDPDISKSQYWKRRDQRLDRYEEQISIALDNGQVQRFMLEKNRCLLVFDVPHSVSDAVLTKVKDMLPEGGVGYRDPLNFVAYALTVLPVSSTGGMLLDGDSLRAYVSAFVESDRKDGYKKLKELFPTLPDITSI